ncbi:MAG: L-threonylcarbamoyladenylate synthase [Piscinibacter sp.]|uniref:L-threonylcarbamoyladenylate synthase n=1 Tax=Piscinibacter sp. TaxID=1903157 RepID=UPI003D0BC021
MLLPGNDAEAIERAADALASGHLVAFPTETVYGLGARADDDLAVSAIFRLKGRPADHPLIVHVTDASGALDFAGHLGDPAQRLVDAFWPGPLTIIVPRAPGVAAAAAGGQDTIGLRCPAHPVAQALLAAARARGVRGVAAPSANRFGRISPTRAQHVVDEFGDDLIVLDGGDCEVGIESSIVDCSGFTPALLRPGQISRKRIEAVLGAPLAAPGADSPRASGTLESHYAPRAKLRLMSAQMLNTALQMLGDSALKLAVYSRTVALPPGSRLERRTMPDDPDRAAHELFATLRELDARNLDLIWVEEPPSEAAWDGVRDRLSRAAAA